MKEKGPGVLGACFAALLGWMIALNLPGGAVLWALLSGFLIGQFMGLRPSLGPGLKFCEKTLLSLAIVFMGINLQLNQVVGLGLHSILVILASISIAIGFGWLLAPLFGMDRKFGLLLGVGNGICGSSAIAGAAPVLNSKEEELGVSVAVVNFLGSIGMFLLPLLVFTELFTSDQISVLIGSTLQAVGHVSGAGLSISESVGQLAITVKLGRVLFLGPVLFILALTFRNKKAGFPVPGFIVGFLVFMAIRSLDLLPVPVVSTLSMTCKVLLCIAMAGVGWRIQLKDLIKAGSQALALGTVLSILQFAAVCALLLLI